MQHDEREHWKEQKRSSWFAHWEMQQFRVKTQGIRWSNHWSQIEIIRGVVFGKELNGLNVIFIILVWFDYFYILLQIWLFIMSTLTK